MNDKKKTCSGFPEKSGACNNPATASVLRLAVCEEHARQAEANNLHVVRHTEKKP